mgnify:CR=1 FL=1
MGRWSHRNRANIRCKIEMRGLKLRCLLLHLFKWVFASPLLEKPCCGSSKLAFSSGVVWIGLAKVDVNITGLLISLKIVKGLGFAEQCFLNELVLG